VAFPRKFLNQDEELVLDLRPHWLYMAPATLALAVAVILSMLAVFWWNPGGTVGSTVNIICGLAVLGTLGFFAWSYAEWTTTNFVLTSDRIVTRRGVLTKTGTEIPLDRINTVFFSQRVIERLVGAGDLGIESAGERGAETFNDIRRPSIVQKEIYVQMEANENRKIDRGRMPHPDAASAAPQHTIPQQIDQLAELHQRGVLSDAEYQQKKAELLGRM